MVVFYFQSVSNRCKLVHTSIASAMTVIVYSNAALGQSACVWFTHKTDLFNQIGLLNTAESGTACPDGSLGSCEAATFSNFNTSSAILINLYNFRAELIAVTALENVQPTVSSNWDLVGPAVSPQGACGIC